MGFLHHGLGVLAPEGFYEVADQKGDLAPALIFFSSCSGLSSNGVSAFFLFLSSLLHGG
jgi:hypothetical protein